MPRHVLIVFAARVNFVHFGRLGRVKGVVAFGGRGNSSPTILRSLLVRVAISIYIIRIRKTPHKECFFIENFYSSVHLKTKGSLRLHDYVFKGRKHTTVCEDACPKNIFLP